jgi:amidohydrolase
VRTQWNGAECGVMHACGHDAHTAILMGVAEALASVRERLAGSVKFLFQPAEEGAPDDEKGGAQLMIEEGCMSEPKVGAVFGLHVTSNHHTGMIGYRSGPLMASADQLKVFLRGEQTHGAMPWRGVDPIVTAAQVVLGLQTIVSRQVDLTHEPAVVTVGAIKGGVRENIIPDAVEMRGTIRSFDEGMRDDLHARVQDTAEHIARAARAGCEVCVVKNYPVTINDSELTEAMLPTLERVAGTKRTVHMPKVAGSEDFSFYQQVVPGLFFFVGVTPHGQDLKTAAPNHSPRFFIDEEGLPLGVRALANLAVDWLEANAA